MIRSAPATAMASRLKCPQATTSISSETVPNRPAGASEGVSARGLQGIEGDGSAGRDAEMAQDVLEQARPPGVEGEQRPRVDRPGVEEATAAGPLPVDQLGRDGDHRAPAARDRALEVIP